MRIFLNLYTIKDMNILELFSLDTARYCQLAHTHTHTGVACICVRQFLDVFNFSKLTCASASVHNVIPQIEHENFVFKHLLVITSTDGIRIYKIFVI